MVSSAWAELGTDLQQAGLEYCRNETPTGVLLPDGRHLVLTTSRERNVKAFDALSDGDGRAYAAGLADVESNAGLIFTLLGSELWSRPVATTLLGQVWKRGLHPTAVVAGSALQSGRAWLETNVQSDLLRAVLAPWVLHTGLGPESALSGLMIRVIALTLEAVGIPLVKGGNANTVRAFRTLNEGRGGVFETGADVERILVRAGKAVGVRLADGREFAGDSIVCNVTPTQLYGRLLPSEAVPEPIRRQAAAYRYGKGNMQIHPALKEPPRWPDPALGEVTYLHLTRGMEGVSRAVDEAQRGLLPAEATICVAQPSAIDPSRAPDGQCVLWVQLPEVPRILRGDALDRIATPADGRWTAAVSEAYADRTIDRLATQAPNLNTAIVGRHVLSPADLERMNVNLVGGDPYSGECGIDQYLLWRPLPGLKNHATPVRDLWHIGASTHPGPGLGGVSGFHVANAIAK